MPNEDEKKLLPYVVFQRGDSGSYAVRFTLKDNDGMTLPQIRIGLQTKDESEAYKRAAREYLNAEVRVENNALVGPASFDKIARDYVETLFADAGGDPKLVGNAKHAKTTVERYFIPKFKKRPVTLPFDGEYEDYQKWRINYRTTGPGSKKPKEAETYLRKGKEVTLNPNKKPASFSTLKRENVYLRGVFKHAVRKGLLRQGDIPKFKLPHFEQNQRIAFTKDQYNKLLVVAENRMLEIAARQLVETDPNKRKKELAYKHRQMYERHQIFCFIIIAAETGMRPGEMFNLNWGHVEGVNAALKTRDGAGVKVHYLSRW